MEIFTSSARRALLCALAASASALVAGAPVRADDTPSLAVEPAPAGDRALLVERAEVDGHLSVSARALFDFAYHPLSLRNPRQALDPVVAYQLWQHNLVSLSIFRRALFHLDVPVVDAEGAGEAPATGATAPRPDAVVAFGDMRLGARVKLYGSADDNVDPKPWDERTEIALGARLWLPTGGEYAGDGAVRGGGGLIISGTGSTMHWGFDAGIRSRPAEELPGAVPTRVATALCFGLSGAFFADDTRSVALGSELALDVTVLGGASFFDPRATVAHWFLTGAYRVGGGPFELGAAVGPGLGAGAGAADVRALLSLGFAPETPPPPPDADRDRVPDKNDACVDLAGEPANDPLLNGCPPPPPDFDGDAIPDEFDACPRAAGVATGVRRTHGCPPDRDGDRVPDATDVCPDKPGPRPPKGNGCPVEKPVPEITDTQIEIAQQIQFETDTALLRAESEPTLEEVAKLMVEHGEIELVEVQGHTDGTGTAERNRELGQARADTVVAWLVAHGVAAERLTAKGYGHDRPIADEDSDEGRAKNRRVEFHILRRREAPP